MRTIAELRAEERRILEKFNARAEGIRETNPRVSREKARTLAMMQMPVCSRKYASVRGTLTSYGVAPMLFDEIE